MVPEFSVRDADVESVLGCDQQRDSFLAENNNVLVFLCSDTLLQLLVPLLTAVKLPSAAQAV